MVKKVVFVVIDFFFGFYQMIFTQLVNTPYLMGYKNHLLYYIVSLFSNSMNRIKQILQDKGIKQTWLSERLHKSFNMVNEYCNNKRQPSLEDLNKIAEILDVDVRDLIVSNKEEQ